MPKNIGSPQDFHQFEAQNLRFHNLGSAPSSPVEGQHYQNTIDHNFYVWNGTQWIAMANDAAVVHKTGAETVAGVKTFSSSPVVPTPTNGTDAANKQYVDDSVNAVAGHDAAPVQAITDLRAVAVADRQDKQLRLVEDKGAIYRFDSTGTGTDDGDGIIAPTTGSGRWFKVSAATQDHNTLNGLQGGATGDYQHLTSTQVGYLPTSGQKQALAGTSGTPSSSNQYVTNADPRNTNARTPTAHSHPSTEISDFDEATYDALALHLVAGTGVSLNKDDTTNTVTVNATGSSAPGSFTADFGDGTQSVFVITHNLNSRDVRPAFRQNAAPYSFWDFDCEATTVNTLTIRAGFVPTANQFRAIIGL